MTPVSTRPQAATDATICIVERDARERASLEHLFAHLQHVAVRGFDSAESLLASSQDSDVRVLVCALELPGMSGLELLRELASRGLQVPTILLSESADVATAVSAMRAGAVDFIQKPVIDRILLRRVRDALEHVAA